jgi:predicted phosphoribosyltransferase
MQFTDRHEAGQRLAQALARYRDEPDVVVLGLPRGGVPVAFEVARSLEVPLDVLIVRKLGLPGHEEFAMGAIASGGTMVRNPDVTPFHVSESAINAVVARERAELERRELLYRGSRPALDVRGSVAILVDDGLATGSTMLAAVRGVRMRGPRAVIVAVPVASQEAVEALRREASDVVCVATPEPFRAVGLWYRDFSQTSDDEVRRLLNRAWQDEASPRTN